MVEYLASVLDDTTETIDGYGPEWDYHQVRVCDLAAKVLADFHLKPPVRFEFEENPAFLNAQIGKLRRVLAGEKDVSFELPAELVMPLDLPTRQARMVIDLPTDYGNLYAMSDEREVWIGDGFEGRGGWAYDTLRIDLGSGMVVERTPLDQWKGGVSLLDNGKFDRAYCYHGYEGGHVTVREPKTGRVVKKVATPFHDGIESNDPLQIRDLGDITMCGKDGRWIMAITPDFALHSIDTESGEHRVEWKYKIPEGEQPFGSGEVLGLQDTSKVLLEEIGGDHLFDAPLRIWDQATRSMTVADKLPKVSWQGGWGDLAWNNWAGVASLWNIKTLKPIRMPRSEEAIKSIACDRDQTTLFALRSGGTVDVFRVTSGASVKPVLRLLPPTAETITSAHVVVSADDRFLFWQGSPRKLDKEGNPVASARTIIGQFEIADLTE
jgi:hypothetical protein